ncbi:hypothetical protein EXIGLDRAFT_48439 [Exidia glandulosa HHB12029]|uniref:Uncharacterized protein n=1 Tax=Exidia glandulosa HHB12029 TaxID=1314781 RepID=A0A165P717_EXIGL|nr:hypothetical protein EXIGLDRAFT_48439 [Exidia glandulosa HHB12029]
MAIAVRRGQRAGQLLLYAAPVRDRVGVKFSYSGVELSSCLLHHLVYDVICASREPTSDLETPTSRFQPDSSLLRRDRGLAAAEVRDICRTRNVISCGFDDIQTRYILPRTAAPSLGSFSRRLRALDAFSRFGHPVSHTSRPPYFDVDENTLHVPGALKCTHRTFERNPRRPR